MGIFLKTVGTTQRDGGITTATLHLTLFTYASDNVSSVTGDWTMVRLTMTLNNLSVPLRWEYFGGYGRCLESESKRLWRHTTGERKQENGMNEGRKTEERKWWLSDWAWKACLHLNTATTCNQMGGLMRKESCLNMMPQCWVAPLGSSERPNGERICAHVRVVCLLYADVCDEGLKVKAKNCITGKQPSGHAQERGRTIYHIHTEARCCYQVLMSNCWERETFPFFPILPGA